MRDDEPLNAFGAHFYQGIADDVADMGELASRALQMMPPEQRRALRTYLSGALARFTPSELKGKLNRAITDYRFNTKSAGALLRATADHLDHSA